MAFSRQAQKFRESPQQGEGVPAAIRARPALRIRGDDADECEELCRLLGVLSPRDTQQTAVRVFRFVVRFEPSSQGEGGGSGSSPSSASGDANRGIRSSAVAEQACINRLTAMHHLNRFVEAGLLEKRGSGYFLRQPNLEELIGEMESEAEETFARARMLARRLEREFL